MILNNLREGAGVDLAEICGNGPRPRESNVTENGINRLLMRGRVEKVPFVMYKVVRDHFQYLPLPDPQSFVLPNPLEEIFAINVDGQFLRAVISFVPLSTGTSYDRRDHLSDEIPA